MKLTTKGRYAVTAMLDLAMNGESSLPVTLGDISQRQDISLSYLEQLFVKLRRQKLVHSVRGPGGGYCLDKAPESIFITDIIYAVDERIEAMSCGGHGNCKDGKMCLTHSLWSDLDDRIRDFLDGVSLASLVEKQARKHANTQNTEAATVNLLSPN